MDMSLETFGQLIGTVGFPSLVAIILLKTLLGNFNKRLDTLDKRLVQLNKTLVMIVRVLNQRSDEKDNKNNIPIIDEASAYTVADKMKRG